MRITGFLKGALLFVGLAAAVAGSVSAQDTFQINYFSNNISILPTATQLAVIVPDATVRIDNPGLTYGNLCAMIYVFAADQQLSECCGCVQSHNNLNTYSVRLNLTSDPLTGVTPTSGVIKIVSAPYPGVCDPTSAYTPTPNLRAWATHVQSPAGGAYPVTETPFSPSTLGATELANLQAQCAFIGILGSGAGVCTCGPVVF